MSDNEPQSYPVVGQALQNLRCGLYIETDKNAFTGRIQGRACLAKEKPGRLAAIAKRFSIDLERSVAYSDHESDLPFFAFVGRGVAVTPTPVLAEGGLRYHDNWLQNLLISGSLGGFRSPPLNPL